MRELYRIGCVITAVIYLPVTKRDRDYLSYLITIFGWPVAITIIATCITQDRYRKFLHRRMVLNELGCYDEGLSDEEYEACLARCGYDYTKSRRFKNKS